MQRKAYVAHFIHSGCWLLVTTDTCHHQPGSAVVNPTWYLKNYTGERCPPSASDGLTLIGCDGSWGPLAGCNSSAVTVHYAAVH